LDVSIKLIEEATRDRDAHIFDVGGGESTLVDDLLVRGCHSLSILDVSSTALTVAKLRLGDKADQVNWLCGDVTTFAFARQQYDVWHDRAVFHFLTDMKDRAAYVRQVAHAASGVALHRIRTWRALVALRIRYGWSCRDGRYVWEAPTADKERLALAAEHPVHRWFQGIVGASSSNSTVLVSVTRRMVGSG